MGVYSRRNGVALEEISTADATGMRWKMLKFAHGWNNLYYHENL